MIVVRLSSGLGNQLFQYAFALYLEEYYQDTVYFDRSCYKYRTSERTCSIDIISTISTIYDRRIFYNYRSIFFHLFKVLFYVNPFVRRIQESNLLFPKNNKFLYFDGFWQTDRFVNELRNRAAYFTPKEEMPFSIRAYFKWIENTHSVSLHVRRGDYFQKGFKDKYGVCGVDYYEKAVKTLIENLPEYRLLVFSDDLDWVKDHLELPKNTLFVENENINPLWYILLMSKCSDNIISNSSFSWWGAYLNENPDKKVIAPAQWMLGESKNIALESWLKI